MCRIKMQFEIINLSQPMGPVTTIQSISVVKTLVDS